MLSGTGVRCILTHRYYTDTLQYFPILRPSIFHSCCRPTIFEGDYIEPMYIKR